MTSIDFYERSTIIKRIENNLNQINRDYFEGNHGVLSVTDNGDYVTVHGRIGDQHFDIQKLWEALENFSEEDREFLFPYDLWDYLDDCKLKTDDELSVFEKQQVALVDMLLGEPVPITESSGLDDWTIGLDDWTTSLIPHSQTIHTEASTLSELVEELEQKNEQLSKQLTVLNETMVQLSIRVYKLEEENKRLKNNQLEVETKVKPEPKPTTKKRPKFKLPENFADYQQECDGLINALSCFYDIKKGKWNGILQFILTPTASQKENYPDKWRAGLYLQPGQWIVDKVKLTDPDDWEDWFMDINDFSDANGIEIS
jgi:hypothetical protein